MTLVFDRLPPPPARPHEIGLPWQPPHPQLQQHQLCWCASGACRNLKPVDSVDAGQALLIINGTLQPAPATPQPRRLTWRALFICVALVIILGVSLGMGFVLYLINSNEEQSHAPVFIQQHSRVCAPIPGQHRDLRDLRRSDM